MPWIVQRDDSQCSSLLLIEGRFDVVDDDGDFLWFLLLLLHRLNERSLDPQSPTILRQSAFELLHVDVVRDLDAPGEVSGGEAASILTLLLMRARHSEQVVFDGDVEVPRSESMDVEIHFEGILPLPPRLLLHLLQVMSECSQVSQGGPSSPRVTVGPDDWSERILQVRDQEVSHCSCSCGLVDW